MAGWTSDELSKIGAAEELEIAVAPERWDAAEASDDLGRSRRRRPLRPLRQRALGHLVPRRSGPP